MSENCPSPHVSSIKAPSSHLCNTSRTKSLGWVWSQAHPKIPTSTVRVWPESRGPQRQWLKRDISQATVFLLLRTLLLIDTAGWLQAFYSIILYIGTSKEWPISDYSRSNYSDCGKTQALVSGLHVFCHPPLTLSFLPSPRWSRERPEGWNSNQAILIHGQQLLWTELMCKEINHLLKMNSEISCGFQLPMLPLSSLLPLIS